MPSQRTPKDQLPSPGSTASEGTNRAVVLEREYAQMKESVRQLIQERENLQQMIATLQAERDHYQRIARAFLKQEFPESDWQDFRAEDYSLSTADVLEILKQLESKAHV